MHKVATIDEMALSRVLLSTFPMLIRVKHLLVGWAHRVLAKCELLRCDGWFLDCLCVCFCNMRVGGGMYS